jgi:hypothetical protein
MRSTPHVGVETAETAGLVALAALALVVTPQASPSSAMRPR